MRTVVEASAIRLVDYAKAHLIGVPIGEIGGLIERGAIRIGGRIGRMAELVHPGDVLEVEPAILAGRPRVTALDREIAIHHADDDLLVCAKPAGMHVHPIGAHRADTLVNCLTWIAGARDDQPWGGWRPYPAHRLDRAASGLIAIAKRAAIHDALRIQLADHAVARRYRAIVHGAMPGEAGVIDAPLGRDPAFDYRRAIVAIARGGQPAITRWTVIERYLDRTLVELDLETGRTHQIRAHLASLGHPIVGDTLYAEQPPETGAPGGTSARVIALHATELRFRQPRTGEEITCVSPPPVDFAER